MGCEQSSLSASRRTSRINTYGKKMSFYQEENKGKDPPSRPMSKMENKTTFYSASRSARPSIAQRQLQLGGDRKDSMQPKISLNSNLHEELQNELSKIEYSQNESLVKEEETEEPAYQITKEQHLEIFNFVKENSRLVHMYCQRLNDHLVKAFKESSELPVIMEYIKSSSKDVENCVDDLTVYPVPDEKEFYAELEQRRKLAKDIKCEYKRYDEQACDYESFRDTVLEILHQYNAIVGESSWMKSTTIMDETMYLAAGIAPPSFNIPLSNEKLEHERADSDKKTGTNTPSTEEDVPRFRGNVEPPENKETNVCEILDETQNEERVKETEQTKEVEQHNEEAEVQKEECIESEDVVLNMQNEERIEENHSEDIVELQSKAAICENSENTGLESNTECFIAEGEPEVRERGDSKGAL